MAAGPALAAGDKPFFSLKKTDFVVSIAFLIFIGILLYFKVPSLVGGMLMDGPEFYSVVVCTSFQVACWGVHAYPKVSG